MPPAWPPVSAMSIETNASSPKSVLRKLMPLPLTVASTPVTSEKVLIWAAMALVAVPDPKVNSRAPAAPASSKLNVPDAAASDVPPSDRNSPAVCADLVTTAVTSRFSPPVFAALILVFTTWLAWPETWKSSEPLSSFVPWKLVVVAIRSMVCRIASTWA